MAYDLAMDMSSGDLALHGRDLVLVDNAERIAQQIVITLKFWLGEWFLDTTEGVPYLEYILVKNPNMAHIRQIFLEALEQIEGITSVDSLELELDAENRQLYVTYAVTTNYGLVTSREVLGYGR